MKQINFIDEIIVDCFAGGGGWSTGIEQATGEPVDIAVNHDPDAILMHKTNHPYTEHYQDDIFMINPQTVTRGRSVGWAHFSPDCKHFSKAKGKKPVDKTIRGLAWIALRWAGTVRPRIISLENVTEFQTWGPLNRQRHPLKKKRGKTFEKFIKQLQDMEYDVEWRELTACDYGAPTTRTRFFLIARCDGRPIVWPEATHGPGLIPYRSAAEIIDWSIPCPSIFDRKKPLVENTLNRIARGLQKFVIDDPKPFILKYYGGFYEGVGSKISEPLGTIRTHDGMALITPYIMQAFGGFNTGAGRSADDPLPTVTAKDHNFLVTPYLAQYHSYDRTARGQLITDPLLTIDTSNRYAVIAPYMMHYYGTSTGASIKDPVGTITSRGQHIAQVQAFLQKYKGGTKSEANGSSFRINKNGGSGNYGNRGNLEEEEHSSARRNPADTRKENGKSSQERLSGSEDLLQGNGTPDSCPSSCMDGPAGRDSGKHGHQPQGREQDEQLSEKLGDCNAQRESESRHIERTENISEFSEGSISEGKGVESERDVILDDSEGTKSITDNSVSCHSFAMKYYGCGTGQSLNEPLDTIVSKDRFGLVMIYGEMYQIVDIGMRMLTPRELYNAQGFPPDYIIDYDYAGKAYPKTAQVARCGNAVPPPFATALVRANWPERCEGKNIRTMKELKECITA